MAETQTCALVCDRAARSEIRKPLQAEGLSVRCFASVDELTSPLPGQPPALIVLARQSVDTNLGKQIESLRQRFEHSPVLVVCSEIQPWEMRSVLSWGVVGVVLTSDLASALRACTRAALSGQVCVPKQHWRQIEPPVLSSREKQILGLVVMGYMNGQIAQQLFLAESTVKSHLSSAFTKLGVRSRNEAVELILNSEQWLGMGILALGGEPLGPASSDQQGADADTEAYRPVEIRR